MICFIKTMFKKTNTCPQKLISYDKNQMKLNYLLYKNKLLNL